MDWSWLANVSIKNYQYLLVLALLVALINKLGKRRNPLWHFTFFISIVVLTEIILSNYFKIVYANNTLLFNVFFIFCINYYVLCLYTKELAPVKKFWPLVLLVGWNLFSLTNLFFIQGFWAINSWTWISGMILTFISIVLFYHRILISDKNRNLLFHPEFILSIGILGMYSTAFPFIFHLDAISQLPRSTAMVFYDFVQYGNIILALSYLYIAFLPLTNFHFLKNRQ